VRLEELGKLKNPMISSGFDPDIFRLVAYWLNQLGYRVPPNPERIKKNQRENQDYDKVRSKISLLTKHYSIN
jgi:hypothetical protein